MVPFLNRFSVGSSSSLVFALEKLLLLNHQWYSLAKIQRPHPFSEPLGFQVLLLKLTSPYSVTSHLLWSSAGVCTLNHSFHNPLGSNRNSFLLLRISRAHSTLESTLIIWPNTSKMFIVMTPITLITLGPVAYAALFNQKKVILKVCL